MATFERVKSGQCWPTADLGVCPAGVCGNGGGKELPEGAGRGPGSGPKEQHGPVHAASHAADAIAGGSWHAAISWRSHGLIWPGCDVQPPHVAGVNKIHMNMILSPSADISSSKYKRG